MIEQKNYYRLKLSYLGEGEKGNLEMKKEEVLVLAVNYSEAELIANELLNDRMQFDANNLSYEIVKTKVSEIVFNSTMCAVQNSGTLASTVEFFFEGDTDAALYSVDVFFDVVNEKGKVKKVRNAIYVPAESPAKAISCIKEYLKGSLVDYCIRNVKYDKATSIYTDIARYTSYLNNGH